MIDFPQMASDRLPDTLPFLFLDLRKTGEREFWMVISPANSIDDTYAWTINVNHAANVAVDD